MFNFPYNATQLTQEINRYPTLYGLMNALGIFPSEAISSRVVEIRFEDGVLVVLGATEVGAPGETTERETGDSVFLGIPHFPHLESVLARDLQDFLDVVGGRKVPKQWATELAKRLKLVRNLHAITREYLRLGALRGNVIDGRGRLVVNLFQAFKITPKTIDFALGTAATDVIGNCSQLVDYYGENMKGETMTGVEVICGRTWFNKFVQHPKVEKYWLQTLNAGQLANIERLRLGGSWGRVFEFQGIAYREYTGTIPVRDPITGKITTVRNMGENEARAYPTGTSNTFVTYDGPVDHMAYVNQPGQEVFISPELLKHGEGVEFKSQSNALPICRRPEFLVDCSTTT